jgi:hypothetical protein
MTGDGVVGDHQGYLSWQGDLSSVEITGDGLPTCEQVRTPGASQGTCFAV